MKCWFTCNEIAFADKSDLLLLREGFPVIHTKKAVLQPMLCTEVLAKFLHVDCLECGFPTAPNDMP